MEKRMKLVELPLDTWVVEPVTASEVNLLSTRAHAAPEAEAARGERIPRTAGAALQRHQGARAGRGRAGSCCRSHAPAVSAVARGAAAGWDRAARSSVRDAPASAQNGAPLLSQRCTVLLAGRDLAASDARAHHARGHRPPPRWKCPWLTAAAASAAEADAGPYP